MAEQNPSNTGFSGPTSFDPAAVPVQPAATVMIVDDRPDLQVLLIKRNTKMVFAGGMWVFPGGRVDPGEADDFEPHCRGLTDADASAILSVESGGLAYWVAAIRENFEEVGLILGSYRDGRPVDTDGLVSDRRHLNQGQLKFLDMVLRHRLVLDASAIHYIAHWVTPLGSPRRFSARFFITRPPAGQTAQHDESETVDWAWMRPADALARFEAGEIVMMTPTIRMLRCLTGFEDAGQVMAAAGANLSAEQVRVQYRADGSYTVLLPGDPGYEDGDPKRESGWIKLRP